MKLPTKLLAQLLTCTFAAVAALAVPAAHAEYPDKPLRLIVPFPPGGNIDATARIISAGLGQRLGATVIVENRAGAAGLTGSEFVARSDADGYTALLGSTGALAPARALHPGTPLQPTKDFAGAGPLARAPLVLAVRTGLPPQNLKDFIAYAKKNPGKLTMASAGVGTAAHLTGELFQKLSGTKFLHVPYKGSSLAVADLLGGHVDLTFDQLASTLTQIKAGKLRALGVTTAQRTNIMPELPTLAESGLPGFEASTTTGLLFPKGTPAPVIAKVNAALQEVLKQPDVQKQFRDLGSDVLLGSGADFDRILRDETAKWDGVIKDAGIAPVE
ncbi:tripartite tricarboxylate transporter substrate binding protein [Bordetella sp. N]|uniref:Bug family tripartite tricarboxylate transporter substrate binding protein n=1 Tax=Bordetella sp. N TaxID=1746199 RepID=UPI000709BCB0|nr:tripartite tricarboxylate transporter substrate binding protein [Bordetella sp. N]ALM85592.1 hypothetical protein ASB57_23860 [Bordetella sp. N]